MLGQDFFNGRLGACHDGCPIAHQHGVEIILEETSEPFFRFDDIMVLFFRQHGERSRRLANQCITDDEHPLALLNEQGRFAGRLLIQEMDDPDPAGEELAVFECPSRLEIHLWSISLRQEQLAPEISPTRLSLSCVITIRHDNVVELALPTDHCRGFCRQGRRVNKDPMLSDGKKQAIEIELLLFGKPGPLPDTWKNWLHERCSPIGRFKDTGGS